MKKTAFLISTILLFGILGHASEWVPIGAKGVGMGGAQVAAPEGSQAILVNPAALANKKRFDMALPVTSFVGAEGTVAEDADKLINSYDETDANGRSVESAFDNLKNGSSNPSADVGKIVKFLATDAAVLDKPGQGVLAGLNASLTMRFGRLGLTAGQRMLAAASVRYDSSLGFRDLNGGSLIAAGKVPAASITAASSTSSDASEIANDNAVSGSGSNLSGAQVQTLSDSVTGTSGGTLSASEKKLLANVVKEINTSNGPNPGSTTGAEIDNNTGLELKLLEVREIGITYAFSFLENRLHFAPVLKVMRGETSTSSISLADSSSEDKDVVDELTEDKNKKSSTNIGLDIGILYDINERFTVGLMAKDLTSPGFELSTGGKIELDPTFRAGVAYQYMEKDGWKGLVAGDLDLIKSDSAVLTGGETQQVALGISQEMMGWLSLRAGLFNNMAGESDGINYTAGLGFQITKFHIDISGIYSSDDITIDGDNIPSRLGFGVTLGWNMNI